MTRPSGRLWDVRKLHSLGGAAAVDIDNEVIEKHIEDKKNKGLMRGEWRHGKSVSSAYWDPHGRRIVSTCYDDAIRRKLIPAADDLV